MADPYQDWYRKWAEKTGINPDPDDPRHFYDYRAAYDAGDEPTLGEDGYHWPSKHKREGHPNMVVDGVDTKTGAPSFGGGSSSGAGAGSDWGLTDRDWGALVGGPQDEDTDTIIAQEETLGQNALRTVGTLGGLSPSLLQRLPEGTHNMLLPPELLPVTVMNWFAKALVPQRPEEETE